ncbi:hypothetical protein ACU045_01850 [Microbacterium sp. MAHUQ-60]|uniref:hypothetical protein n=1 Tax=unclassified Microbacterium TaxID=2609290 RepID=UPI003618306D
MKALTTSAGVQDHGGRATPLWEAVWEWVARPSHYAGVRRLRTLAQAQDQAALVAALHPDVTVAVTTTQDGQESTVVARGPRDAAPVLLYGFRGGHGVQVAERTVNGQAGLAMTRGDELTALITVDFTGRLVSLVWVRMRPDHAHRGRSYWCAAS